MKKNKAFYKKTTGLTTTVTINEENFPELAPELFEEIPSAELKRTAVSSLSLTGL